MASKDASKSVMGNLPSTRPARIGGRREAADGEAAAKPKAAGKRRAVRSGSPALKAAKDKKDKKAATTPPPRKPQPAQPPKGAELVTTAVQAAGELAQIGLTLGGQAVKRAVRRLPKP